MPLVVAYNFNYLFISLFRLIANLEIKVTS